MEFSKLSSDQQDFVRSVYHAVGIELNIQEETADMAHGLEDSLSELTGSIALER